MHFCPIKTKYLSKLKTFPSKKQNFLPDCKMSLEWDSLPCLLQDMIVDCWNLHCEIFHLNVYNIVVCWLFCITLMIEFTCMHEFSTAQRWIYPVLRCKMRNEEVPRFVQYQIDSHFIITFYSLAEQYIISRAFVSECRSKNDRNIHL